MVAQNSLRFRLDGVEYTLRSDKPLEKLEAIVKAVEEKIEEIRRQAPYYSQTRAATLAALMLSEELQELQEEYDGVAAKAGLPSR